MKLQGVEVYAPQDGETLLGRGGPFHTYARAATVRALRDMGIARFDRFAYIHPRMTAIDAH